MSIRHLFVPALLLAALTTVSCTQTPPGSAQGNTAKSAAAAAANAAGTWTWTYDGGAAGQAITHTYVIKQSGETLTGTFKDSYDETTAEIKGGKIHDGQVSFTVARPLMGNDMVFTFTGKLQGDTIKGQANWTMADQPTTADWLAKRGA